MLVVQTSFNKIHLNFWCLVDKLLSHVSGGVNKSGQNAVPALNTRGHMSVIKEQDKTVETRHYINNFILMLKNH